MSISSADYVEAKQSYHFRIISLDDYCKNRLKSMQDASEHIKSLNPYHKKSKLVAIPHPKVIPGITDDERKKYINRLYVNSTKSKTWDKLKKFFTILSSLNIIDELD